MDECTANAMVMYILYMWPISKLHTRTRGTHLRSSISARLQFNSPSAQYNMTTSPSQLPSSMGEDVFPSSPLRASLAPPGAYEEAPRSVLAEPQFSDFAPKMPTMFDFDADMALPLPNTGLPVSPPPILFAGGLPSVEEDFLDDMFSEDEDGMAKFVDQSDKADQKKYANLWKSLKRKWGRFCKGVRKKAKKVAKKAVAKAKKAAARALRAEQKAKKAAARALRAEQKAKKATKAFYPTTATPLSTPLYCVPVVPVGAEYGRAFSLAINFETLLLSICNSQGGKAAPQLKRTFHVTARNPTGRASAFVTFLLAAMGPPCVVLSWMQGQNTIGDWRRLKAACKAHGVKSTSAVSENGFMFSQGRAYLALRALQNANKTVTTYALQETYAAIRAKDEAALQAALQNASVECLGQCTRHKRKSPATASQRKKPRAAPAFHIDAMVASFGANLQAANTFSSPLTLGVWV